MLARLNNPGANMMKKEWLAVLALGLVLAACQKNEEGVGPAEQAGRKLDQITEKTGRELNQAAQDASEKLNQAARDAKVKIDAASEQAGEKMEEAGQKLKDRNNSPETGKDAEK
jgi:predicted small secreted protein